MRQLNIDNSRLPLKGLLCSPLPVPPSPSFYFPWTATTFLMTLSVTPVYEAKSHETYLCLLPPWSPLPKRNRFQVVVLPRPLTMSLIRVSSRISVVSSPGHGATVFWVFPYLYLSCIGSMWNISRKCFQLKLLGLMLLFLIIISSFHTRNICGITTIKLKSFSKQNQAPMFFSGAQCMKHQTSYYFFLSLIFPVINGSADIQIKYLYTAFEVQQFPVLVEQWQTQPVQPTGATSTIT